MAKSLTHHSTVTLAMDHYTRMFIEDERSALTRLPELKTHAGKTESLRALGTGSA